MFNKEIAKRVFYYRGKYWIYNIKMIPRYFREIHFFHKYGYDSFATYETFSWFTSTIRNILKYYREHHYGYKETDHSLGEEENVRLWNEKIDHMIQLLDDMDEDNPKYDIPDDIPVKEMIEQEKEYYNQRDKAKDEFFDIFSKLFWDLWD